MTGPCETGDKWILIRINQFAFTLQSKSRSSQIYTKRNLVGVRGILGRSVGNVLDVDEEFPQVFALVRVLVGVT